MEMQIIVPRNRLPKRRRIQKPLQSKPLKLLRVDTNSSYFYDTVHSSTTRNAAHCKNRG